MASLTIRNLSDELLARLREVAADEKRSVNAQALYWLERAARSSRSAGERMRLFERIWANREAIGRRHGPGTDSVKLIRQMRSQRPGSRR
jgi:plasmid stability protein